MPLTLRLPPTPPLHTQCLASVLESCMEGPAILAFDNAGDFGSILWDGILPAMLKFAKPFICVIVTRDGPTMSVPPAPYGLEILDAMQANMVHVVDVESIDGAVAEGVAAEVFGEGADPAVVKAAADYALATSKGVSFHHRVIVRLFCITSPPSPPSTMHAYS